MKDNYIFTNFFKDEEYRNIARNNPKIFELYEKYYFHGDLTKTINTGKGEYQEYLSSPLIEIIISDPIFSWYIEERVVKNDSFKGEIIMLLWKVNNNFKNLYGSVNKSELIERFTIIFDILLDFINMTYQLVDHKEDPDVNDIIMLTTEHIMNIINNSFKNSIVIKYLILSALCEYVKQHFGEDINEDEIVYLIRRFITNNEYD